MNEHEDIKSDEEIVAIWRSAGHEEFSTADLQRLERALHGTYKPACIAALRAIVRRGRSIAEFKCETHLIEPLLRITIPHIQDEKLAVRSAAVAATVVLAPNHSALALVEKDEESWVRIAARYAEEDVERVELNQIVLGIISRVPSEKWLETTIAFARSYAPHPAWRDITESLLFAGTETAANWLSRLLTMVTIPVQVDGLTFSYGYSCDVEPVFKLNVSGQEFEDYDTLFESERYIDGCELEVLNQLEKLFPSSSQEPIVCAIRNVCLASIVTQICEKHRDQLLTDNSELALGIGYGGVSFVQIGSLSDDGWEP